MIGVGSATPGRPLDRGAQQSQGRGRCAARFSGVGEDALAVAFRQMQNFVAELELPDFGVTEPLASARAQAHVMACPEGREFGALHAQFAHQFRKTAVIRELRGDVAQRRDGPGGLIAPIDVQIAGVLVEEQKSDLVGTIVDASGRVDVEVTGEKTMTGIVPREDVVEPPQEHGRHGAHRMQQLHGTRFGDLGCSSPRPLDRGGTRERVQVSAFVYVEPQRASEGVDDGVGGVLRLPLLQPRQIGDRHSGEQGQFLAAQAGHAAPAVAGDSGLLRADPIPAGAQELTQLGHGLRELRGVQAGVKRESIHASSLTHPLEASLPLRVLGIGRRLYPGIWPSRSRERSLDPMSDTDVSPALHSPAARARAERFTPSQRTAMTVLLAANFTLAVDFSILNVALPVIGSDLGFATDALQWIVTAFALCAAGFTLLFGRVADLFGRKRLFLTGIVILGLASAAGGLAQEPALLLTARVGQGLATAMVTPAALSLMTTMFPDGPARSRALGLNGALMAAGFTVGAVLGGILTGAISWRWAFFINVIVALAVLAVGPFVLREPSRRSRLRLDVPGAILVTAALVALVFGIDNAGRTGWAAPGTWAPILIALVLFAILLGVEGRTAQPLIAPSLLARRNIGWGNAAGFLAFATFTSLVFLLTLYLQEILGYTSLAAGLFLGVLGVGTVIGGLIAPKIIGRTSAKTAIVGYAVASTAGVPSDQQGLATGLVTMSQQVGITLGTPVMSAIATGVAASTLLPGLQLAIGINAGVALLSAVLVAAFLPSALVATPSPEQLVASHGR